MRIFCAGGCGEVRTTVRELERILGGDRNVFYLDCGSGYMYV